MSKVQLQGNVSGTGIFTIASPNSNTDRTLTLPDNTGTLLTSGSAIARTQMYAGAVLQVVSAFTTTAVSNSTITYIDTGLTASITPTSATSKILVLVSQMCYKSSGNSNSAPNIKLFRDATDLGRVVYAQSYSGTAIEFYSMAAFQYYDSPATTSSVTYKTQFANNVAAASAAVQPDNIGRSTIVLMEIAA